MKKLIQLTIAAALCAAFSGAAAADDTWTGAGLSGVSMEERIQVPAVPAPAQPEEPRSAGSAPVHGYSAGQLDQMKSYNFGLLKKGVSVTGDDKAERKYRPFADYEAPGYLIMSGRFEFNSQQAKLELARQLPADATLVLFTDYDDAATKETLLKYYEPVVPRQRIKIVAIPGSYMGFWARDGIPVPVIDRSGGLVVVDAVYGHRFEPDAQIAGMFKAGLEKHQYYYEGGNFMANHAGDCIMINHGAHVSIPDSVFTGQYGCRQMIRLPFVDGIGHIDEHVRFISEKAVLTDLAQYKDTLQGKGLTVHMLPKPSGPFETYVNSLIMNDRVIVPTFGRASDKQAMAVYESLGLKASGADSRDLSNKGQGSVHCITMTYPKVPMAKLLKALGGREI